MSLTLINKSLSKRAGPVRLVRGDKGEVAGNPSRRRRLLRHTVCCRPRIRAGHLAHGRPGRPAQLHVERGDQLGWRVRRHGDVCRRAGLLRRRGLGVVAIARRRTGRMAASPWASPAWSCVVCSQPAASGSTRLRSPPAAARPVSTARRRQSSSARPAADPACLFCRSFFPCGPCP